LHKGVNFCEVELQKLYSHPWISWTWRNNTAQWSSDRTACGTLWLNLEFCKPM